MTACRCCTTLVNALRGASASISGAPMRAPPRRDAFRLGHGVCQDFAHIFISARHLGVPARYIGGYLVQMNGGVAQDAGHAWAEAMSTISAGSDSTLPTASA
jgi:hypothetical protein